MHRIFIVEDDAAIAAALQKHLTTWGFDVRCAEDFRNVLAECTAFDPQLVLLDIALPFYNGYHWCQELRRVSNVPVVFISSASDNMNIVMAMNMGGDDFIAKPFDLNVLLAKIQAGRGGVCGARVSVFAAGLACGRLPALCRASAPAAAAGAGALAGGRTEILKIGQRTAVQKRTAVLCVSKKSFRPAESVFRTL